SAWILNLFRRKDKVRIGRKLLASITVTAVLVILLVFAISTMGILSARDIAERTGETGSFTTSTSTMARLLAWNAILEDLSGRSLIMGRGMGATYTSFRPDIGTVMTVHYVDSSYFQLALNMGVVGVIIFMSIFVVTMVKAARLFVRTESRRRAGIALGIFCAVILLLFASGFASVLTNYRYSMLWAMLPALLQMEILRDDKELEQGMSS
ncbi:MAG: O-antigen ligase family protein, partial [Candidatus Fermentibacteraceae bacterium]|nr:O-antigen ligase family protein [Candidatus Fermentibacteraceae bacterium]